MALLSLGFLLLAIMLGFIRKMNTGLLCIAFALLLGRMAGISDAEIIKGFNASLFLMLLGVTYLFSLAQINGSLDLLAQKVISLAGKRVYLIPIIIYVLTKVIPLFPIPDILFNMWYCPFPICTWLTTRSLFGIVLMLIVFAASWMIWMPFFKIYDKQVCEEEAAEQK